MKRRGEQEAVHGAVPMWTLQGKRAGIYSFLAAHGGESAVCIKTKPSRRLFLLLLEQTKVREISISPGLWKTVPAKVRAALENVGVKVDVAGKRAGRPVKYAKEAREMALGMVWEGRTANEIARIFGLPQTALYWWKRQAGLVKKRRKKNRERIKP